MVRIMLFADLTGTRGWHTFLDIAYVIGATGAAGSLLVGVAEVIYSSIRNRPGRFGEAVAYVFILGGVGGLVVEGLAKLGVS
jgi:hypothetical protein